MSLPLMSVEVPIVLPSVANLREHRVVSWTRSKIQRQAVTIAMQSRLLRPGLNACRGELLQRVGTEKVLAVMFTRVAPRSLDDDNNVRAAKACRDAVAKLLGCDDNLEGPISWFYTQEKGSPASLKIDVVAIKQEPTQSNGTSSNSSVRRKTIRKPRSEAVR